METNWIDPNIMPADAKRNIIVLIKKKAGLR